MGYDSSVYLIYGIKINIHNQDFTVEEKIAHCIELLMPGFLDQFDNDDDIHCICANLAIKPSKNGYYCFSIGNDFFVACYVHEHVSARSSDDCLEVTLPSQELLDKFGSWVVENNIEGEPKFYTKLYESY